MNPAEPWPPSPVTPLAWVGQPADGWLELLDQTCLPAAETWLRRTDAQTVVDDIRRLAVRGAPAIGVAGAYALLLAARALPARGQGFAAGLEQAAEGIAAARPTAVNLRFAVEQALVAVRGLPADAVPAALLAAARRRERAEVEASHAIARHGAAWLGDRRRILTHCNAGALAALGLGTALAPIYLLHARGEPVRVWVDETRPLLQGLRLTAWELARAGVPHQVLVEGAAAGLLRRGAVDAVLVGADRVCANGDVVNKVGTYGVALAAARHGVPFGVAAPLSTLDPATPDGDGVAIEERPLDGVRYLLPGTAPDGLEAWGPAFDVTPAALVSALVTERGVLRAPDRSGLAPWMAHVGTLQAGREGGR